MSCEYLSLGMVPGSVVARRLGFYSGCMYAMLIVALTTAESRAQFGVQYTYLPPKLTATEPAAQAQEVRQRQAMKDKAVRSNQFQQADLKAWYADYFFRAITASGPSQLGKIADLRYQLKRDFSFVQNQQAHDYIVTTALGYCPKIADMSEFHPAVRYNAMLIVADLNDVEESRSDRSPPQPSMKALAAMLASWQKENQIDPVRVAILIGLARHAELDLVQPDNKKMPAAARQKIQDAMLELAGAVSPPPGRSAEGHAWMRRQALEILGRLGESGADAKVVKIMEQTLSGPDEQLPVQIAAASALASIKLAPSDIANADTVIEKLGELALIACNHELQEQLDMRAQGSMGGYGGEGGGRGGYGYGAGPGPDAMMMEGSGRDDAYGYGDEYGGEGGVSRRPRRPRAVEETLNDPRTAAMRRRLLYRLEIVLHAYEGVAPGNGVNSVAADPAQKRLIGDIKSEINKIITDLSDHLTTLEDLEPKLLAATKDLRDTLPNASEIKIPGEQMTGPDASKLLPNLEGVDAPKRPEAKPLDNFPTDILNE
ncbi:MAG: hypothetical protein R3E01_12110 [Pirellulaceae bacterium]|nr:hypothetical protein [Planctomycetales bacterium]